MRDEIVDRACATGSCIAPGAARPLTRRRAGRRRPRRPRADHGRGPHALTAADVVVADRLAPRELLDELPADVELIDVAKLPRGRSAPQEEINRVIVERALAGKRVVRFKGGDNFVFGRGYEEVLACARGRRPGDASSPG